MIPSPFPDWVRFAVVDTASPLRPEEQGLVGPRAVEKRRRDVALGRTAARQALGRNVALPRGPAGAPVWPADVVGSITHSAGLGAAAVAPAARAHGIGLDLEDVTAVRDAGIARLVADDMEQRWIDGDRARLVSVFSAKEAVYKAFQPTRGVFFGFDAVTLRGTEDGFEAVLREAMGPGYPAGWRFEVRCITQGTLVLTGVLLEAAGH